MALKEYNYLIYWSKTTLINRKYVKNLLFLQFTAFCMLFKLKLCWQNQILWICFEREPW